MNLENLIFPFDPSLFYLSAMSRLDSHRPKTETCFVFFKGMNDELISRFNGNLFGIKYTDSKGFSGKLNMKYYYP